VALVLPLPQMRVLLVLQVLLDRISPLAVAVEPTIIKSESMVVLAAAGAVMVVLEVQA